MKLKYISIFILFLLVSSCIGTSSSGVFGTGVSVAFDPRSIGTQIDDSIMQKNLTARLVLREKSYLLSIKTKGYTPVNASTHEFRCPLDFDAIIKLSTHTLNKSRN